MTADKIPDDIKLLLVIHPKAISDSAQYAIDQFVLRGGKLVAFVDPFCALDHSRAANWSDAAPERFDSGQTVQGLGTDV